jgi:membrane-associated protease RseP (regulator of RpoE activity)
MLLLATALTATEVGGNHFLSFLLDFGARRVVAGPGALLAGGLWYSLTILAILGAHEMGHYLACRYYGINASLPFFIPAPYTMIGTFGAFIRIRQPLRNKRELFDIGVAGPFAGFLVALPTLFYGLSLSRVARVPASFQGVELGEPLLFQFASRALWGTIPDGYSLNLHPMALAAWFGLLATLLNLFPLGQLDGGHVSYAVLGRRSRYVTLATVGAAVVLTFVSLSWLVWTLLMGGMLIAFGPQHPPTLDEDVPLDPTRRWLALAALVIFVLCFTPAPIQPLDLLHR